MSKIAKQEGQKWPKWLLSTFDIFAERERIPFALIAKLSQNCSNHNSFF